jgi:hypothetical protein
MCREMKSHLLGQAVKRERAGEMKTRERDEDWRER